MANVGVKHERVQTALEAWGKRRDQQTFGLVMLECLSGDLLLDISTSTFTDPQNPFQQGDTLAVAEQVDNAGKRLLLAYTDHARMEARKGGPARSLVQPAAAVMEMAINRYEGIAIDAGHGDVFISYTPELVQNLTERPSEVTKVKTALLEHKVSWQELLDLVAGSPMFFPFFQHHDEQGNLVGLSMAYTDDPEHGKLATACTAPAEVFAWGPDMGAQAASFADIARKAVQDGCGGVLLNPVGMGVLIPAQDMLRLSGLS